MGIGRPIKEAPLPGYAESSDGGPGHIGKARLARDLVAAKLGNGATVQEASRQIAVNEELVKATPSALEYSQPRAAAHVSRP